MLGMYLVAALSLLVVITAMLPPALAQTAPNESPAAAPARYYAVTLLTSFAPFTDRSAVEKQFPGLIVYETKASAFGKDIYFLRLGFFASFSDANATKKKILASFPGAWATEVPATEYETALGGGKPAPKAPMRAAAEAPKKPAAARPAPRAEAVYAVELASSTTADIGPAKALPPEFKDRRLYVARRGEAGHERYLLNLGFFANATEAEAARKELLAVYPGATVVTVSREEQQASAKTAMPVPVPTPAAPGKPAPAVAAEEMVPSTSETPSDRRAAPLMAQGRAALIRGDDTAAIAAFDALLRLPPNRFSRDAREFVGLAHERRGEIAAARQEYELYLKLYPDSEGAERVRQRLASLGTAPAPVALKPVPQKPAAQTTVYGSLSQYFYHGASKIQTTTTTVPSASAATLSQTDQKSLITTLNLNERTRSENYDNRVVVQDSYVKNYLTGQYSTNRLYAAYYEFKDRKADYSLRVGRQPGYSGGVLGIFDGVLAGFGVAPKWRVNAVAGVPWDLYMDSHRYFYGMSVDMGTFAEHWNNSTYVIRQLADGVTDREAVGNELRYFDPNKSFYTLLDYDIAFHTLNIAMLQANWTGSSSTAYNLLVDRRKTPPLQLSNALIGAPVTSIKTLLDTNTYEELKTQARGNTATSTIYMLGATHPITNKWQLGGSVQQTRVSATEGTATLPPAPGTGNIHTYTGQLIGTGLFSPRDISVVSYSYIQSPLYHGDTALITNRSLFGSHWVVDTSVRWYAQKDTLDTKLTRVTPDIKFSYLYKRMTFELELGTEDSKTTTPTSDSKIRRNYWSLGYRWDF